MTNKELLEKIETVKGKIWYLEVSTDRFTAEDWKYRNELSAELGKLYQEKNARGL